MTAITKEQLSDFKASARAYANVLLRRGKITKLSCTVCGNPKAEMHHTDYTQPAKVYWVCRPCHRALHKAENAYREYSAELDTLFDLGKS